jgi:hypothetical protein
VYWRFDFDVAGTTNRISEDRLFGGVVQARELSRKRDAKTTWTISNPLTNESYKLVPGGRDGVADKYGRNDIWFVKNKANEVDDGVNCTSGGSCPTWANIEKFVTQESIQDTDVIVQRALRSRRAERQPDHGGPTSSWKVAARTSGDERAASAALFRSVPVESEDRAAARPTYWASFVVQNGRTGRVQRKLSASWKRPRRRLRQPRLF